MIQITFQGHSGVRFPLEQYPGNIVKASELYAERGFVQLHDYGFKADYIMMDGGQENRNYMNKIMSETSKPCIFLCARISAKLPQNTQ